MAYITPTDLYLDENLDNTEYDSTHVAMRIEFAQQTIERVTGKFFEPVTMTLNLDGSGEEELLLPMPLRTFTQIRYRDDDNSFTELNKSNFHNYNQYFDRDYPRLAIIDTLDSLEISTDLFSFPVGSGNIEITGEWAYLDRDGNTPADIKMACKILTMDFINRAGDYTMREDLERRNLAEEEVDGHRWESHEKISGGKFTGNKEVDQILAHYVTKGSAVLIGPNSGMNERRYNKRIYLRRNGLYGQRY